jgi:hypothetical protein
LVDIPPQRHLSSEHRSKPRRELEEVAPHALREAALLEEGKAAEYEPLRRSCREVSPY